MEELNRRNLLRAGGAAGTVGALSLATAANAWSWSPTGSVVGSGTGADPRWVWDDEADPVVAGLISRGETAKVNALLATWKKNNQPLPDGLPKDLHDFIEKARQLPSWYDQAKIDDGFKLTHDRGQYIILLYILASGMISTAIPREARSVYWSKGGADLKDRIAKTTKLGYWIQQPNNYKPDGEMIVTTVKTRLVHAAVRHLLPQSPMWKAGASEQIPISQADILVTWHSLPTNVMQKLAAWKIKIPASQSAGFLHTWQVTAHMLGVKDEYIPATWDQANAQSKQVLDPILAATPEGIKLADELVRLGAELDGSIITRPFLNAMTRYTLGDKICDMMKIPRDFVWDSFVKAAFPAYLAFREAALPLPLAPQGYYLFDTLTREAINLFLGEGKPIIIDIPDINRPS
ncbi:oxygenase MpaB family protein [Psychromicrobium lacuslunae]|uniref:Latex clearing protein n=1 Tax=Psychromicrobium lacuslunae TaxID=1618207 RepID=A0A0D4C1L8_9MICC|nr:oxygenase MpaB family protein [Psychromicrobium lacuslunae]AJT42459.1 Latex clearing protein [Psychromicrobium lacuslunae]